MRIKKGITLLVAACLSMNVLAVTHMENQTQVGRYLTVTNNPLPAQKNLLQQTIQVRFPQNVQTIGEAVNYILRFSGYSVVSLHQRSPALKTILTKPLPAIDRNYGPMTLKDALTTLVGESFELISDPINRTVNFRLKAAYAKSYH